MKPDDNPNREGHTREWQDRARVVLDAKEKAKTEASPNQSPVSGQDRGEENRNERAETSDDNRDDAVY